MNFPSNKKFAFSIFDDTDKATVINIKPVYDLLTKLKIYTTKSVWVFSHDKKESPAIQGQALIDSEYLKFILELKERGFEISFHGAKGISSKRKETLEAIEYFKNVIGHYPKSYANHLSNRESIYWGSDRPDNQFLKLLYRIATLKKNRQFEGHLLNSEYFWGDCCREHIKYVRNFTFPKINTFRMNPSMPYHDSAKPYVNFWFSSSDGHNVETFNKLLCKKNQDKLEHEGGICIVYTHFANGFVKDGKVNSTTEKLLIELSQKNGWFVPVSALLDFLLSKNKKDNYNLPFVEKTKMELMWFFYKIVYGTS